MAKRKPYKSTYKATYTIKKGIKFAIMVLLGLILAGLPIKYPELWNFTIGSTTIGALLVMGYDWLKHYWGIKLP